MKKKHLAAYIAEVDDRHGEHIADLYKRIKTLEAHLEMQATENWIVNERIEHLREVVGAVPQVKPCEPGYMKDRQQ